MSDRNDIDSPVASIAPWLARWRLTPDGPAFTTPFGSRLMPVIAAGAPAMLKIAGSAEERDGAALMAWWDGDGAARVIAHEGEALLLERSMAPDTLAAMVRAGRDDEATAIVCAAAARLHRPRLSPPPPTLRPLETWFAALWPVAEREGGPFARAAEAARTLLAAPADVAVLHGDLHHDNVLDFAERGWLVIDPKGLVGERGYDLANLFRNPWPEAADPGRLARRLDLAADMAGVDRSRLARWALAHAGLSAAWTLGDGGDPWRALRIADIVAGEF